MTSLWFQSALLSDGWAEKVRVSFDRNRIGRIEEGVDPAPGDARHGIAIPGLPNLHSHAFQRGMAGLTETRGPAHDSFWTWRDVMYRFIDRLTPDDVQAIAELAYIEMLERGFTRVGEFHYVHHDSGGRPYANIAELGARIAAASGETGIALTLLPVFYAHSNFGGKPPVPGQRRFLNDPASFAKLMDASRKAIASLDNANIGIAPHSLRATAPEELKTIVPLAQGGPIHIHAAEQTKEVEDCIAWSGARPVQWLLDHAGVDSRWCLVHATHMTAEETARLARSNAVAGLCPITEANLGDGIFPMPDYIAAGGRFGIGSDSNVLISAPEELRTLEYAQRLTLRGRNVLVAEAGQSSGRALYDGALTGGHQALGVSVFGLKEGAPADLVSLDADNPGLAGKKADTILDSWIFAGAGSVDCVWRAGVCLVERGRHKRREQIARRYKEVLAHIVN
ncbi:MAG: formimidoylglutamate deiminase [Proteobacteria bacterium]|nr:formimidoylglutamate deiminase [Pseudomonadota bacterium]